MALELRGPSGHSLTDNPVSLTYGKYDDLRMPWVGRKPHLRVVTVTDAITRLANLNEDRVWISIQNIGVSPVCVGFDGSLAFDLDGIKLNGNNSILVFDRLMPWADIITGICGTGLSTTLLVSEFSQPVQGGRGD